MFALNCWIVMNNEIKRKTRESAWGRGGGGAKTLTRCSDTGEEDDSRDFSPAHFSSHLSPRDILRFSHMPINISAGECVEQEGNAPEGI